MLIITMGPNMRPHAVDYRLPLLTRRSFLRATSLAFACSLRPLVAGFTAIADELAALMRWCASGPTLRFAAG